MGTVPNPGSAMNSHSWYISLIVVGNQRRALIQRSDSDDPTGSKRRIAKAACPRGVGRSRRRAPERIAAERTSAETASLTESASLAEAPLPGP